MPLQYRSTSTLVEEHTDAINCVALSPDGLFVASGSTDKRIVVWSLSSGQAIHRLVTHSAVLSLLWRSSPSRIICGTADGTLITAAFNEENIYVSGFSAHSKPIECLSLSKGTTASRHLATAAHNVVNIWSSVENDTYWDYGDTLDAPPSTPYSASHSVIITSVQWMNDPSADCLVTAYLHHGIICSRRGTGSIEVLWSIHLPLCGACNISPANDTLAVCNITSGFDVYAIPSGLRRLVLEVPSEPPGMALPIVYIHKGTMLLGGASNGKVRLWDARSGDIVQTLRYHGKFDPLLIQCVAENPDTFLLATGSSDPGVPNSIQVWELRDVAE
ncbi:WD40 repeat-like protein [Sparassis crispa]|uniref:WD40 repeat-like protein n=1 Tax=Sparassis crispa TaxID=139825 RepID=A0A401H5K1_9APHY|nr:WD40 repeat-like protein [Sparassis crispa]GBE89659.1 WD40 repeat-like protein [Sparassis crispa]